MQFSILSCVAILGFLTNMTSALPVTDDTTTTTIEKRAAGKATYYNPGLGACGNWHTDNDLVVALPHELFDTGTPGGNPNKNKFCGKRIRFYHGPNRVDVSVVDRCPSCKSDVFDLSVSAFRALANTDLGHIQIGWDWI